MKQEWKWNCGPANCVTELGNILLPCIIPIGIGKHLRTAVRRVHEMRRRKHVYRGCTYRKSRGRTHKFLNVFVANSRVWVQFQQKKQQQQQRLPLLFVVLGCYKMQVIVACNGDCPLRLLIQCLYSCSQLPRR